MSRAERADSREIAALLPTEPRAETVWYLRDVAFEDELGGETTTFHRVRTVTGPEIRTLMTPEDWESFERGLHGHWAAECHCSCCGVTYHVGWPNRGHRQLGIVAAARYAGYTEAAEIERGWESESHKGEYISLGSYIICPECGVLTTLTHKSQLRRGKTFQSQIGSLERAGDYAALIYWIATRRFDEDGDVDESIRPREAIVIDRAGKLRRFSHTRYCNKGEADLGEWKEMAMMDPEDRAFYSWGNGGGVYRNTKGSWFCEAALPHLEGSTGEKTGLREYIDAGGERPVQYLLLWNKHHNVENLVKGGWSSYIKESIGQTIRLANGRNELPWTETLAWVDLSQAKPHRMLRMTREEVRKGAKWHWSLAEMESYIKRAQPLGISATDYNTALKAWGSTDVTDLLGKHMDGWPNMEPRRVLRYLDKQKREGGGGGLLRCFIDYRAMLETQMGPEQPTPEQLWPPHLRDAHDRLAMSLHIEGDTKYLAEFIRLSQEYEDLRWTDGSYFVRAALSNEELIREGKILRHCVGSYGTDHVKGKPIFFVRRTRRPDAPYYTLNEDMTGELPRRIQIHGYKNDAMRRIPQPVLDFVKRWEREILEPWMLRKQAEQTKELKKGSAA